MISNETQPIAGSFTTSYSEVKINFNPSTAAWSFSQAVFLFLIFAPNIDHYCHKVTTLYEPHLWRCSIRRRLNLITTPRGIHPERKQGSALTGSLPHFEAPAFFGSNLAKSVVVSRHYSWEKACHSGAWEVCLKNRGKWGSGWAWGLIGGVVGIYSPFNAFKPK